MKSKSYSTQTGRVSFIYRVTGVIIIGCAIIVATGCSPKAPKAPRWDTKWSIPLSNKTYSIEDILNELGEENLIIDSTGVPRLEITEPVDTFEIGDNLSSSGISDVFAEEMGQVEIDAPSGQAIVTPLTDFLTESSGIVPPVSFSFNDILNSFSEFTWATIEEGKLYLQVTNNLEVDLDTLTVQVIDDFDESVIGTIEYTNGVSTGETKIDSINLAGKTIHNQLKTFTIGHTPGGDISAFTLEDLNLTAVSSYSNNFVVSAANAKVPEIAKNFSENFELSDSTIIDTAYISSGNMTITINNKTNLQVNLTVTVPNITNSEGTSLTFTGTLNGNTEEDIVRNLSGYRIHPNGSSSPQTLPANVSATILSSGENLVDISETDSIIVTENLSTMSFTSIKGKIKPTAVEIEPSSIDIELPEGLEQATLTEATLYLKFYNSSELDADLDITLTGNNSKTLPITGRINGKNPGATQARLDTIMVGPDQLSAFLNPAPTQINFAGNAVFNPDYVIGTVAQADFVYGEILITSPLAFSLSDTAEIELDIESQEISEDAPDFNDRVHYAVINADIDSHLPVGAEVSVYISTLSDSTMYSDPNTIIIGPMYLIPAQVDENGHAIAETSTSFTDSLTADEVLIFDNDIIYIGQKVKIYTSDPGSGIEIQSDDYITIKTTAITEFEIGGED